MKGATALLAAAPLSLLVLIGGCKESPFAALPEARGCGSAGAPCHYRCDLPCAAQAVTLATDCLIPLEGKLDPARRRCTFDDGSEVRFSSPLAETQSLLSVQDLSFTLLRQKRRCISVIADRGPDRPGRARLTSVVFGARRYVQKVRFAEGPVDGGSPIVARIELECLDGLHYLGEAPFVCSECQRADGGPCAMTPPLVRLRVSLAGSIQFLLEERDRTTPLFTCRR